MVRVLPGSPKRRRAARQTDWAAELDAQLVYAMAHRPLMPGPIREYSFAKAIGRRWRFDLAWPERMLAVEIEGGVFIGGRHTRGAGFVADCIKYNEAAILGWKVLRFIPQQVESGEAVLVIRRVLMPEGSQ